MRLRTASALAVIALAAAAWTAAGRVRRDAPGTFSVMTFNIQHGIDGSHRYRLQRAVDAITRAHPDVVALQEVTRNHPYYDCDDQPARLADRLRDTTGQSWTVVYEQEWFTFNVECQQQGRGDGRETEGLAFLAPSKLGPTAMTPLPVSRIGFAVRIPAAGGLPIVVTHLASGSENADARRREMDVLLKWAAGIDAAAIVGDFNVKPDDPVLQAVTSTYRDAWTAAVAAGTAAGTEATHGRNRVDYVFYRAQRLQLMSIRTIETASWLSSAASDHNPVVATFRVRQPS